jgi:hypothetical protein
VITQITLIALGAVLLLLVCVVFVQCLWISRLDRENTIRVAQKELERRRARASETPRDSDERSHPDD